MTQDETVALFLECEAKRGAARAAALSEGKSEVEAEEIAHEAAKAHWNAWAESLLAKRRAMEAGRRWASEVTAFSTLEPKNEATRTWITAAAVDFTRTLFLAKGLEKTEENTGKKNNKDDKLPVKSIPLDGNGADFSGFIFPAAANFDSATFSGSANFYGTHFSGDANFSSAAFSSKADFQSAVFSGDADFHSVAFICASFYRTHFRRQASFLGINSKGIFYLMRARFWRRVPDFALAKFTEPIVLDNVQLATGVEPGGLLRSLLLGWVWANIYPGLSARYRMLKRLAIQSDDHRNEQIFFRGELRARRYSEDMPWHPAFWFGILYELASDFGHSISRPVLWLIALSLISTWFYLGQHTPTDVSPRAQLQARIVSHLPDRVLALLPAAQAGPLPALSCKHGDGDPAAAAAMLAVRQSSVLGALDTLKSTQIYTCLYGQDSETKGPVVPDTVVLWGFAQTVLSAALWFLFLLALRNQFKIK